jgi:hypothetical protein
MRPVLSLVEAVTSNRSGDRRPQPVVRKTMQNNTAAGLVKPRAMHVVRFLVIERVVAITSSVVTAPLQLEACVQQSAMAHVGEYGLTSSGAPLTVRC